MNDTHELKIWPEYFGPVDTGVKTFEVRLFDRDFKVGDRLLLKEWLQVAEEYTGRETSVKITYIMPISGRIIGFPRGDGLERYAVMAIKRSEVVLS